MTIEKRTCDRPGNDPLMIRYHDEEWGVPVHDDLKLFEFLVLDAFQAGLSWRTVLHKRENFRKAFHEFKPDLISRYNEGDFSRLMNDAGIIRNRAKIRGTIENARRFLEIQKESGSFNSWIWQFTDGATIVNHWSSLNEIPARSIESDMMSKALVKRGFKFVGSTICYAFMQAAGMVNDHLVHCYRYCELTGK